MPSDNVPSGGLEDFGVPLSDDAEFGIGVDRDGEVDLVAADETAAVGKKEYEDALLGGGWRGRYKFEGVLEGHFCESRDAMREELDYQLSLSWRRGGGREW